MIYLNTHVSEGMLTNVVVQERVKEMLSGRNLIYMCFSHLVQETIGVFDKKKVYIIDLFEREKFDSESEFIRSQIGGTYRLHTLLIESESVDFTSEDEEITFFVLNNAVFSGAEHLVSLSYIADLTNLAKRLSDEGRVTRVIVAHS